MKKLSGKIPPEEMISHYHEKLKADMEFRAHLPGICMSYASPVPAAKNREEVEMLGSVLRILGPITELSLIRRFSPQKKDVYLIRERGSGRGLPKEQIHKRIMEAILSGYVLVPKEKKS